MSDQPEPTEGTEPVVEEQLAFDVADFPGGIAGGDRGGADGRRRAGERPCRWRRCSSGRSPTSRPPWPTSRPGTPSSSRGFTVRQVGGGWRIYSRHEYAPVVEKFVLDGQQARLTQASLETLAVIAYRQPVSRARVAAVRGVNVDGVIRTLLTRGLIEEMGHDEESTRHPVRDDVLLPGAAGAAEPRRPARPGPLPARGRRARRDR